MYTLELLILNVISMSDFTSTSNLGSLKIPSTIPRQALVFIFSAATQPLVSATTMTVSLLLLFLLRFAGAWND